MNVYFITFRSVTFAQRGERTLRHSGIFSQLQRTPRWMEEQGCGYCLVVGAEEIVSAVKILKQSNIQYRKIYYRVDADVVKEVNL